MASGATGGGADHLKGLLPALRTHGVQCSAVVGGDGPLQEQLAQAGFLTANADLMRSRTSVTAVVELARQVRLMGASVVHCHGTRAGFYGALARPMFHLPLVYTAHGLAFRQESSPPRRGLLWAAEALACRVAHRVISVSSADLEELERRWALAPGRGVHIPNAVDCDRFRPGDRRSARRRLGLPEGAFIVGTVARLVPQKAVADLLAAVSAVPGAHLVVVGDGPERSTLEQAASRMTAPVYFLGTRSDVDRILPAFDVFSLSSHWEGEPVALLEAMATGLACVATATGGVVELLGHDERGLVVPVADIGALGRALAALAAQPDCRRALGTSARREARERTWKRLVRRVVDVYDGL
jgi:glycosyltransferase involved in cell wall biosynthesis